MTYTVLLMRQYYFSIYKGARKLLFHCFPSYIYRLSGALKFGKVKINAIAIIVYP